MPLFKTWEDKEKYEREKAILEKLERLTKMIESQKAAPREIKGDVLDEFKRFCVVDLKSTESTAKRHALKVKRFLEYAKKSPQEITEDDVRSYLFQFKDAPANTYANQLKALRRFFRDFLRSGVMNGFKFPRRTISPKVVPTKEQLQKFFNFLKTPRDRALFLLYATTGLRRNEIAELRLENIDFEKRMIIPPIKSTTTKLRWVTFFNEEAKRALREYLAECKDLDPKSKLFPKSRQISIIFQKASEELGVKISPQILREWFSVEMAKLGVPDRYVDAFCGRVPQSVIARHYSDYSPEVLKEIYDKANLRLLS